MKGPANFLKCQLNPTFETMNRLFKIFKVDSAEAAKISTSPDEPHEHDFEELIIAREGQLEHFIDFENSTLDAPLVSFVAKGKIHRVIPKLKNGKCDMWVLRFKSEFLPEISFQLYANYHKHAMLKILDNNAFKRMNTICEIIDEEMKQENADLSLVSCLLKALFKMIEAERNKIQPGENDLAHTQNTTLHNFLRILEENYHRPLGVDFYAEKLFMSTRNLNLICKHIFQQTVTEIIETRKLTEAKNMLTYSDKNISEIGFELGYNEKSYFSNVFKKRTGQTPSAFREEMRKLLS